MKRREVRRPRTRVRVARSGAARGRGRAPIRKQADARGTRLFLFEAPPVACPALAKSWPGRIIETGASWIPSAIGNPPPCASDVMLLWITDPQSIDLARINALHGHHPRVPLVARLPRAAKGKASLLLSAGVQEIVTRAADVEHAVELARARIELLAEVTRAGGGQRARGSYEGLFPNLYDWIYVVGVAEDGALAFETVNPPLHATEEFLNPDFIGRSPEACLPRENATLMRSHLERVLDEGRPLQFEEEQPVAGRIRTFQTTLTPVRNKWGRIHRIAGISRDMTTLKDAQAALGASEERLALALQGTQQGLWDWNLASDKVYRSPRWFEMLGLAPDSVEPTSHGGLSRIHPDDRAGVARSMRLHLDGHSPGFQSEYRIYTGSGEWLWFFDAGKVVSWTADGKPARVAGLCTDITERRRAEESLRALIGGVVHEMRNPAFGIGVNIDALEATFGSEPQTKPFLMALRESCSRILNLMNDLRDYGETRVVRAEPCRIRNLVDEAACACAVLARERQCRVRADFEDDALVLPVHAFRMQQVFRNLIENALFHAPRGSEVVVSSRLEERAHQRWAIFTVVDDGPGFDSECLRRAFEPFFTRRKEGTGLGLSIVRRVVEEHGGRVAAGNRERGGAVVTLQLPVPHSSAAAETARG